MWMGISGPVPAGAVKDLMAFTSSLPTVSGLVRLSCRKLQAISVLEDQSATAYSLQRVNRYMGSMSRLKVHTSPELNESLFGVRGLVSALFPCHARSLPPSYRIRRSNEKCRPDWEVRSSFKSQLKRGRERDS